MDKRMLTAHTGSPFFEAVVLRAQVLAIHEGSGELLPGVLDPIIGKTIIQKIEFRIKRYIQLLASKLETSYLRVSSLICGTSLFQVVLILNTMQAGLNAIFRYGCGAYDWKRSQL